MRAPTADCGHTPLFYIVANPIAPHAALHYAHANTEQSPKWGSHLSSPWVAWQKVRIPSIIKISSSPHQFNELKQEKSFPSPFRSSTQALFSLPYACGITFLDTVCTVCAGAEERDSTWRPVQSSLSLHTLPSALGRRQTVSKTRARKRKKRRLDGRGSWTLQWQWATCKEGAKAWERTFECSRTDDLERGAPHSEETGPKRRRTTAWRCFGVDGDRISWRLDAQLGGEQSLVACQVHPVVTCLSWKDFSEVWTTSSNHTMPLWF